MAENKIKNNYEKTINSPKWIIHQGGQNSQVCEAILTEGKP